MASFAYEYIKSEFYGHLLPRLCQLQGLAHSMADLINIIMEIYNFGNLLCIFFYVILLWNIKYLALIGSEPIYGHNDCQSI